MAKEGISISLDKVNIKYINDVRFNYRLPSFSYTINKLLTVIRTNKKLEENILRNIRGDK